MTKRNSLEQQIANSMKKNKSRKHAQRQRARRKLINQRSLQMENLEERIVLAADLGINEEMELLSAQLGDSLTLIHTSQPYDASQPFTAPVPLATSAPPSELGIRTIHNAAAADTTNADDIWDGTTLDLDGTGYTVGVWDGGDIRSTHQEFGARVTVVDSVGISSHATHVAGTIGALGTNAAAQGMANNVTIRSRDFNSDQTEMAADAASIDASNHSYGQIAGWFQAVDSDFGVSTTSGFVDVWFEDRDTFSTEDTSFGKYTTSSAGLDGILASNPHLLSVWSSGNDRNDSYGDISGDDAYVAWSSVAGAWALFDDTAFAPPGGDGNSGTGYDSLSPDQNAKNSLVVGAINDATVNEPVLTGDIVATSFSSYGPTDDGRIKPDVVGNGASLFSTESASDTAYGNKSGTSMSSPNVTGTSVLLIEHYEDEMGSAPTAATTKGVVIHNAVDGGNTGPDYAFGWGLVDALASSTFITNASMSGTTDHVEELSYTGSTQMMTYVSDGTTPLKATIVWTDAAGTAHGNGLDLTTSVLVNDLDLNITGPGGTHHPWNLDPSSPADPAFRTTSNHRDNVEQVLIDAPAAGVYSINISDTGGVGSQNFTLLVSGATNANIVLDNGDLVFNDIADRDDTLHLEIDTNTNELVISDPNNTLTSGAGTTGSGSNEVRVPLASITGDIILNTFGGNDSVEIDHDGGLMDFDIYFNGAADDDLLILSGDPGAPIDTTYDVGPTNDAGTITSVNGVTQTINFTGLEPVVDTVVATTLTINGTADANTITVDNGGADPANGFVSVDAFETYEFANKGELIVNGLGDDDEVDVDIATQPAALTQITINGGDGEDDLNIDASAAAITVDLNGEGDDDFISLAFANSDNDPILGPVNVDGGAGDDFFDIDDYNTATVKTIDLTSTQIDGLTGDTVTYTAVEDLDLDSADSEDTTLNVLSTLGTVDYYVDLVYAGSTGVVTFGNATADFDDLTGDMDPFAGDLELYTESTDVTVQIDDTANATGRTATISEPFADYIRIAGFGAGVIDIDQSSEVIDVLNIQAGSAADTLNVNFHNAVTSGEFDMNDGDDIVNVDASEIDTAGLTLLGGNPGAGSVPGDTINVDLTGITTPVLTIIPEATGAAGGFGNSGGGSPFAFAEFENVNAVPVIPFDVIIDMPMSVSYGGDGAPDTITLEMNDAGTHLGVNVNGVEQAALLESAVRSVTVLGSGDADTLQINENATGGLPTLEGATVGGHTNPTFTGTTAPVDFADADGDDDININFIGGAGADALGMAFTTAQDVGYFSDEAAPANSGVASVNGAFNLSFEGLAPFVLVGAGGSLIVDASSNASVTTMDIRDDLGDVAGVGGNFIDGNGTFEDVSYAGFPAVTVRSGPGADIITLEGLDPAGTFPQTTILLDSDNLLNSDASDDTVNIENLPATITATVTTGAGDDTINIGDTNNLDGVLGAVNISGETHAGVGPAVLTTTAKGASTTVSIDVGDILNVLDSANAAGSTYDISDTTIQRAGTGLITYDTIELAWVFAGSAANAINVTNTAAGTALLIDGGADVDTVTVTTTGAGSILDIATLNGDDIVRIDGTGAGSQVLVSGGGDNDTLTVGAASGGADSGVRIVGNDGDDIITIESTDAERNQIEGRAGEDTFNVWGTGAGTFTDILGGTEDDEYNFVDPGTTHVNAINGFICVLAGAGEDTLNIDDTGDATDNTYHMDRTLIGGGAFNSGAPVPGGIWGPTGLVEYNADLEHLDVDLGSGNNTLNIDETDVAGTAGSGGTVQIDAGTGDSTWNIQGNLLDLGATNAAHTYDGNTGNDTFNVFLTATTVLAVESIQINGNDQGATAATDADIVNLWMNEAADGVRNILLTYMEDLSGDVDIAGIGTLLDINTVEQVNVEGDAADDDTINVVAVAGVANIMSVTPIDDDEVNVYRNGAPMLLPPGDTPGGNIPGYLGSSPGPDLNIDGLERTSFSITGSGPGFDNRLVVNAPTEDRNGTSGAAGWAGSAHDMNPATGTVRAVGAAWDEIDATDSLVEIVNNIIGAMVDVAFTGFLALDPLDKSLVINAGEESAAALGTGIADDITVTLSADPNFDIQVNGGDPILPNPPAKVGDRLNILAPPAADFNIWADLNGVLGISATHPITGLTGAVGSDNIEILNVRPDDLSQTVNIFGDNSDDPANAVPQADDITVLGRDTDQLLGFPSSDVDGVNEAWVLINGSLPVGISNVRFLNIESRDLDDINKIEPYADDTIGGWDIDVSLDGGDGVDDVVYGHIVDPSTTLGHECVDPTPDGSVSGVSEGVVIATSATDAAGQIRATNLADGSDIVTIDLVNTEDVHAYLNDSAAGDADTLTILGSGEDDVFDVDFTNAGTQAEPLVVKASTGAIDVENFRQATAVPNDEPTLGTLAAVTFDGLEGDDTFNVEPIAATEVHVIGGAPIGSINGDPDIFNLITADTGQTVTFFPGPEPDSGTFVIDLGGLNIDASFDEIELLQVDGVAFVMQDGFEDIDYDATDDDPNNVLALATDIGSDITAVYRDLTLHTTVGGNGATDPTTTDVDYYRYTAHYTGKLAINASFIHDDGDVTIEVQDSAGGSIATNDTSASGVDREDIEIPVVAGEDYFIRVSSVDDVPTIYTLEVENFAAPVPNEPVLDPNDDSGWAHDDNVTRTSDATIYIHASLTDFTSTGVPILTAAEAAANTLGAAAVNPGAAVEVFVNGATVGFADAVGGSTNFFTIELTEAEMETGIGLSPGTLNPGDLGWLDLVTATVTIFDGDTADQAGGRTVLSEPMWMNFDDIDPRAANISIAMLDASDTNVVPDGVTMINQPAFWGVAEENTKIRLFADLDQDDTWEMVGEAVVGSDRTDVANDANLPEASLGGAADDGLGLWEITSEPLRDGIYNIRVEVEDQAGNVTVDTATPLEITVDTLAPQRPTVDLVGMDVQDPLGQFDFTAGGVFAPGVAPVNTDTGWSTHDNITRGIDPANPGGQGTTDVMLRVSAEPDSTVLLKDGEDVIANFTMPPLPYADQGPGGDIFVFVLVTLDEDPHPLSAEAFDLAGNRSAQSEELLVTIDVTPPAEAATTDLIESSDTFDDFAGLTGAVWTDSDDNTRINTPTFAGVAEKNTLVRIVATDTVAGTAQVIGEGLVGSDESNGPTQDGLGTYSVEVSALADGIYDITVLVEDAAGNTSPVNTALQVTVDTVAPQRPTVDLQDSDDSGRSDMDNTTISDPAEADGTVDVRYSAELGSRVIIKDGETVIDDFIFNAAEDATDGGATDGFGLRRIDFVANTGAFGIPAEGAHPITVEAYDIPGNRSAQSEELLITIDFTPPAPTPAPNLLSSSDSGQENDDNVTHIVTPAFDGTGERNSIVRVWATPGAGNSGARQLIGEGIVGSNESDGDRDGSLPEQIGIWEVTVEPLEDGVWTITTTLEDKAGNISAESAGLEIEIDTYQPNTPFLDLVEASDSGRHNDDNVTNDTTPTFTMTSHDPNNADHIDPLNFIFRIYDRDEESNETLLYDSLTDIGDFTSLTILTETVALDENWHNLKLEVEDRAGNISEDFLLDVLIDTTAYAGEGDLHPDSDTGIWGYPATMTDHYTSDKLPEFFGTAEANNLVIMEISSNGGATYFPAGFAVATPLDGDDAFQPQNSPNDIVEGNWWVQTTIDDADGSLLADGEHLVRFTYEDVAGNRVTPNPFTIFVDSEGPVVTNVTHGTVYEEGIFAAAIFDGETSLFDPKPSSGPEPLVSSIVVHFSDGPARTANYQQNALFLATAIEEGHFTLVGDANGVIPILAVNPVTSTSRSGLTITDSSPGSEAILGLELVVHTNANGVLYDFDDVGEPLPDDRFTLVVSDSLTDYAGNALDGESSATAPFDGNNFNAPTAPVFPTGDGVHGGDFAARFTNDTYAELGVYAAGNIWVDTNGNFHFDPENVDQSNRDITYGMGFVTDDIFAGNFIEAQGGTADGFDKLGGYGIVNGVWRWLIDTDNDGVVDIDRSNTLANVNGLPFAGRFDGNDTNGDEVAVFDGTTWWLDSDHSFSIDAGDTTFSGDMRGLPFAGDFDGDGLDDLGTWMDDHFYLDFASDGLDGNADADFHFGFIGTREAPIAGDFDGDDIDDIGLWVPGREGVAPREGAEWFVLMSHGSSIANHVRFDSRLGMNVADFEPDPFGYDLSATFGDEFARPVVGNFDPPNLTPTDGGSETLDFLPFDVDGDGDPAKLLDGFTIVEGIAKIMEQNGTPRQQLFALEASAPFLDQDRDSAITLLDVHMTIRAVADNFQGVGGVAEGEGRSSRRFVDAPNVVDQQESSVKADDSNEEKFFARFGEEDDDQLDGLAEGSPITNDDVDDFFGKF